MPVDSGILRKMLKSSKYNENDLTNFQGFYKYPKPSFKIYLKLAELLELHAIMEHQNYFFDIDRPLQTKFDRKTTMASIGNKTLQI